MTIKVTGILAVNPVFNGTSKKTGKPYSIYSWLISGNVDGVPETNLSVKSMKQFEMKPGIDITVKEQPPYNGIVSYMIEPENKPFQRGGYQRPTYTLEEYDNIWKHGIKMMLNNSKDSALKDIIPIECRRELISTYVISAVNSGVKVNNAPVTPSNKPDSKKIPEKPLQGATDSMNGNETTSKPDINDKTDIADDFYGEPPDDLNF